MLKWIRVLRLDMYMESLAWRLGTHRDDYRHMYPRVVNT
jgi:hypothetical protein